MNDILRDFDEPGSPVVATEFVGTSISTNGDGFFDGDRRGYVRCTLDRSLWRSDLRMVSTVSRADAPVETFASFVVESGRPGAVPA